jgi:hypothetical protein
MSYQINRNFLVLLLLCIISKFSFAQEANSLKKEITIFLPADSLIRSLHKLEVITHTSFAFDPDLLRSKRNEDLRAVSMPLNLLMSKLLSGSNLSFNLVGKDLVITPKKIVMWTVHGHVLNSGSGEEIVAATVQVPALKLGVNTNQYGFYSLNLPEGDYEMQVSNTGYQTRTETIHLASDLQKEIELIYQDNSLQEIVITSSTPDPIMLNEQNMSQRQIKKSAYYAGDPDVLKNLQMENGIKAITEGSSGLFVRGGNADQNLIMLDEAIIYNPSHLYGLVSVFNPDAINNIQIYRDYMPANFGGRLSSVILNRMAEGNSKEYHIAGGISLMSARLAVEGPIVKNKSSFLIAYRRSLLDVFPNKFKLFNPSSVYYDINAKVNYKVSENNTLYYAAYVGKDNLLSTDNYGNNWGNLTSTLRWNHIFNSRLFSNISAIFSNYSNLLDLNADTLSQKSQWNTAVRDFNVKADYTYYLSPENQIKFGISTIYHQFKPGEMYKQKDFEFNIARNKSLESAMYYSQQLTLNKKFELNYGLRVGLFMNALEKENVFDDQGNLLEQKEWKSFFKPEPRVNLNYVYKEDQRFFVTYNLNYQYLQLVQNSTLAFSSLEPWIPASKSVKPQRSDHVSIGYRYAPPRFLMSINAYYKKLVNQLDLIGHAQIIGNPDITSQLRSGRSNAYGIETEIDKTVGKLSGSISYTYSRVYRTIGDINSGNRFASNYDVPHEVKLIAKYNYNARLSFQSYFTYSTGRPLTLPVGYYQHDGLNVPIYEGRNTSRFPDFSRLDISVQYQFFSKISEDRSFSNTFSLGIYNLYNRKNALYYHLNSSSFEPKANSFEYAFGFYPWIAYSFKI